MAYPTIIYIPEGEHSPQERRLLIRSYREQLPNAALRRSPSKKYNCHGLVFASRRAFIQALTFMDTTFALAAVLEDDGYTRIEEHEVEVGDVAIYRDHQTRIIHHSGIVVQVDTPLGQPTGGVLLIMSKWGQAGEYLHSPFHIPEDYPHHIEYLTDRL